ncbi:ROK family transcriptional regulator [Schleiferilactobacillus harbinensis]|uniref:ROK family transcriptional regulator n=1 Tax=Schleiferilactobacillus harbinensis TaxID=304207 RepID=A0ABU7T3G1_9LACO
MEQLRRQDILHQHNIKLVLREMFNHQKISRVDIARRLKLNKSTVSNLYSELEERGYTLEVGSGESTKAGGRKPVLLTINTKFGYFLNFDLGFNHLHVMANYFNGDVAYFRRINTRDYSIHQILTVIDHEIQKSFRQVQTDEGLLGICFSIHGVVVNNKVVTSPWINMEDVNLVEYFTAKYAVPIILENEANLAAIYERDFNGAAGKENILMLSIHKGIGAGIIWNNRLYRGYNGTAGEIGRSLMFTDGNSLLNDKKQKVEDYCSEDAIIDQIKEQKQLTTLIRDDVVRLDAEGDQEVKQILTSFSDSIARIIFNVTTTLAPEAIYINSPLIESIPRLMSQIQRALHQLGITQPVALTKNSSYATMLGGCSLILHRVMEMDDFDLHFT